MIEFKTPIRNVDQGVKRTGKFVFISHHMLGQGYHKQLHRDVGMALPIRVHAWRVSLHYMLQSSGVMNEYIDALLR